MALSTFPLFPERARYRYRLTIDGRLYVWRFDWSERGQSWRMHVGLPGDIWLAQNVRIVLGWPLLYRRRDERLPSGHIFAVDLSGQDCPPGRFDLGDRVRLLYLPAASVPSEPEALAITIITS